MESLGCKNLFHILKLNSNEMEDDSNICTARNIEVVMAIRKYCSILLGKLKKTTKYQEDSDSDPEYTKYNSLLIM